MERRRAQLGAVGSRLCPEKHIQRIHRRIEPGLQDRDLRLDLSERTLGLAYLKLGGDFLLVLELDRGEKLTARLRLFSGDRDARLQPSHRDVHIRRLRGDGQLCCHSAGFGCLILRACGFPPSPQSAEHVDFPTRADIGLVVAAAAVEVGRGVEHLSELRLNRLIGSCALRAHIGRWKQR